MKKNSLLFFILRLVVGGLFVYSGYSKLMEPVSNFTGAILGYKLVGVRAAAWAAAVLPWAELVAGVFFMLGLWFRAALGVLWGMNAVFLAAILSTFVRHIPLADCGCFGEGAHAMPMGAILILDVFLFLIFLAMSRKREEAAHVGLDRFFR